jgi:acyl-CoA reductase-like NAD-dependent aldehyde dehydrogenase
VELKVIIRNCLLIYLNFNHKAVNAICDNPLVKAVTFVGTSKVAELISQRCRTLNKRALALGGAKNHLVAAPDCNVEMTAQGKRYVKLKNQTFSN